MECRCLPDPLLPIPTPTIQNHPLQDLHQNLLIQHPAAPQAIQGWFQQEEEEEVVVILGGALERRPASLNQVQIHLPKRQQLTNHHHPNQVQTHLPTQQQLTNQPIPKPNRRLNSQRLALQTPVGAQARERKGLET